MHYGDTNQTVVTVLNAVRKIEELGYLCGELHVGSGFNWMLLTKGNSNKRVYALLVFLHEVRELKMVTLIETWEQIHVLDLQYSLVIATGGWQYQYRPREVRAGKIYRRNDHGEWASYGVGWTEFSLSKIATPLEE
ncbi:hypothetical protein A2801_03360 [Candidatus Woesebacteria bacterium RIFCSPHIGHO2_01_FULL_41_10]|uniref:Uncharacterized protein n=1 Tax=Candidatus Woesebacteria bacterium RIFCSPHIGHO2_01_FULL_41_10 TaxID=1802500 RepID=A0A1F7YTZ3_9BACT|nr:MAG: hypothetical protein A2801_03360 [Candidatus Woesebacteria bacterium RIFCSPHIGHO2_01_FULL_41_10]